MLRFATILLLSVLTASAETLWVTENGAGGADGSSLANAWPRSSINNAANWGVGAGKVSAGDTVILSGTLTNQVKVLGSGTAGNYITITFDTGAEIVCPVLPADGGIQIDGRSYIIIDGGTALIREGQVVSGSSGVIRNTQNGIGLLYTNQFTTGVGGNGTGGFTATCDNCIVRDLIVSNMFYRPLGTGSSDNNSCGNAIAFISCSDVTISNCLGADATGVMPYGTGSGNRSNIFWISNSLVRFNHGIDIGAPTTGNEGVKNVGLFGNYFEPAMEWDNPNGPLHTDGSFLVCEASTDGPYIDTIYYAGNTFSSNITTYTTAALGSSIIAYQKVVRNVFIWNNLFYGSLTGGDTRYWANGFIQLGGSNVFCWGNTMVGSAIAAVSGTNALYMNNLATHGSFNFGANVYNDWNATTNGLSPHQIDELILTTFYTGNYTDYNIYWLDTSLNNFGQTLTSGYGGQSRWDGQIFSTLSAWQTRDNNAGGYSLPLWNTAHADPNSTTAAPTFVAGTFIPSISDTVANAKGTNWTTLLSAQPGFRVDMLLDRAGVARPASGRWTIGAFEAQSDSGTVTGTRGPGLKIKLGR